VLFWSQFFCLICSIGATYATTYAGFTACRTLQGFFGAPPQVIGLSIVHDMFFFHERARKINIWAFSFLIGPYLGPFISGLIVSKLSWRDTLSVLCGFYGFSVLMVVLFGDETLYDRESGQVEKSGRGFKERILRITGVRGVQLAGNKPGLWEVTKDLFGMIRRPQLLLPSEYSRKQMLSVKLTRSRSGLCHPSNRMDYWFSLYHDSVC
jgi:MFS family permease